MKVKEKKLYPSYLTFLASRVRIFFQPGLLKEKEKKNRKEL